MIPINRIRDISDVFWGPLEEITSSHYHPRRVSVNGFLLPPLSPYVGSMIMYDKRDPKWLKIFQESIPSVNMDKIYSESLEQGSKVINNFTIRDIFSGSKMKGVIFAIDRHVKSIVRPGS